MSRLLRAIFVVAAMLALQPHDSLAGHITEQQVIAAFLGLQARVEALEQGAGQIGGVVDCDDGGATQVLVHIPGRSTVARTDSTGNFVLSNVPVGTWDVVFELAGEVIHTEADVSVFDQLGTDLGLLDICPDVDADGFDVTLDCDDTDVDINPDATEVCDAVDNDCDGQVDENLPGTGVACDGNDTDLCKEGITFCDPVIGDIICNDTSGNNVEICNNNDDDCDGLVDEDFDLNTDENNCGFCGNVCAALEVCLAGSCVGGAASNALR